jgi:hypothetical protein
MVYRHVSGVAGKYSRDRNAPAGPNDGGQVMNAFRSTFIDLFSGCGGLSLGLMNAGWHGLFAIEQSTDAFKTLVHNLVEEREHNMGKPRFDWPSWLEKEPHEVAEFVRTQRRRLGKMRGEVQLVAGGPPCQGFSFAGRRTGKDPRNELFKHHLEVVDIVQKEFANERGALRGSFLRDYFLFQNVVIGDAESPGINLRTDFSGQRGHGLFIPKANKTLLRCRERISKAGDIV